MLADGLPERLAGRLARGRAAARARALSTATIRRKTEKSAQDETTGLKRPVWRVVHADEAIRYVTGGQQTAGGSRGVEIGGVVYQEGTGRADFRHDLVDLLDGDHIDITGGEWAGTVLKVVEAAKGDQRTARRVPIVEVPRPTEWEA